MKETNLLLGYNFCEHFVVAVSGDHVVFVNDAAAAVAGEDYVGKSVSFMLGEQNAEFAKSGGSAVIDDADFFDRHCRLNILPGEPVLLVFSPSERSEEGTLSALSAFATNLRNPFSDMVLAADGLRRMLDGHGNDKVAQYLAYIDHSGHRMLHMLERIALVYNVSMPEPELRSRPGELSHFCNIVVTNTADAVSPLGIPIIFEDSPKVFTNFDYRKVEQALLCLMSNSLKYTRDGNHISVKVASSDKFCYITVSDKGTGISPARQSKLGEILRDERREVARGSGLGLRIVREIAGMHGGSVMFESQEGVGTTVTFSLAKDSRANIMSDSFVGQRTAGPYLVELSAILETADFAALRARAKDGGFPVVK